MSTLNHVLEHSQQYGVASLPTAELFTLVLCGERISKQREKALQLIQRVLADRHDTSAILSTDVHELFAHEFDNKLAYRLVALLELHRRLARPTTEERYQIRSPRDVANLVMPEMRQLKTERMRILVLDTKNRVVFNQDMYQGTVNSSVLRAAEVFRLAVVRNCPAIVVCHNHPSGDPTPSPVIWRKMCQEDIVKLVPLSSVSRHSRDDSLSMSAHERSFRQEKPWELLSQGTML